MINGIEDEIYEYVNQKLDEIVGTLNVTKESTDREKLDAILLYTLTTVGMLIFMIMETVAAFSMIEKLG